MKKLQFIVVATIALLSVGWAGGKCVVPTVVQPKKIDVWSGAYVGAQLGMVAGKGDVVIPAYPAKFSVKQSSVAGGLYAGYNWLGDDDILFGLEADISGVSADKSENSHFRRHKKTYKIKQYYDVFLRERVGKVVDNKYLPYLTAGVAWRD